MRKNIVSIQFLRFIAATIVVVVHASHALTQHYFVGSLPDSFVYLANVGASGVHIFFVISGFVMVYTSFHTLNSKFSPSKFLFRRLIRIYPIYFIYVACYFYFYDLFADGIHLPLGYFIGSLFLFPGYSAHIIGPGWTLGFEVYFYFCFSIAMILGLNRGIFVLTTVFFAAIASRFFFDVSQPFIHVATNPLLIEFLAGAFIGYAVVSAITVPNKIANSLLALGLLGFVVGFILGYGRLPQVLSWGIPSIFLVGGIVFREYNGHVPSIIKKYAFMGDSSYSLYLLHVLLIDVIILSIIHLDSNLIAHIASIGIVGMEIACLLLTICCVIIAHFSYSFIERNVVDRLKHAYDRVIPARSVS